MKWFRILTAMTLLAGATVLTAQPPAADTPPPPVHHPRGRIAAPQAVTDALHAAAFKRHGHRVGRLPKASQSSFDCRTAFGNVLPVDDQGSCGDCFGVSSADGCSMALIKAGILPLDASKGRMSSQYGLDNSNAFQGGCNGGDEAQVIDFIKHYGPYTARPGRPKPLTGMQIYKIGDWGYCTPAQQQGVASTQDIKDCMIQHGPISVAFDASECDNYQWPGTMTGRGQNVDHAVLCIGWDDTHDNGDGSMGAFLGMNQWGASWGGPGGTFWIKYGADSWGTEAIWIAAGTIPPPPPPVNYVPPFSLFEGAKQVGSTCPDTATAHTAAVALATQDNTAVTVKDSAGALVETVQPPPPPPPPAPPTVTIPDQQVTVPRGHGVITIKGGTYPVTGVGQNVDIAKAFKDEVVKRLKAKGWTDAQIQAINWQQLIEIILEILAQLNPPAPVPPAPTGHGCLPTTPWSIAV